MKIFYRDMIKSDIPQVSELMLLLQSDQTKYDKGVAKNSPNKFMLETTLQGVLENDLQSVVVAVDDNKVFGVLFGWISRERTAYFPLENYLYLSDGILLPEYRGKGHYERLLNSLERWGANKGCKHILCEIYTNNKSIQNIMTAYGYEMYKIRYHKDLVRSTQER